jgi:glycosyltransferase involved in cell wall biosynthesis
MTVADTAGKVEVTLLTGGIDRPYTFGLVMELITKGAGLDVIGSDGVDFPEFHGKPGLNFLNLQGSQRPDVSLISKVFRLLTYYARLIRYAATAKPKIFHILWNNKFEVFDRTLLTLFFRLLGKRIVLTVHNVNAAKRDSKDTRLNRLTLRIQYRLADHIFVHAERLKLELGKDFSVPETRVTVIPFGINNAVPSTSLSRSEARQRLGIEDGKKTILFFGRITRYKGLEYLVTAFQQLLTRNDDYRLIVAGRPENDYQRYWNAIQGRIQEDAGKGRVLLRAVHIPDDETELYFKAADVLVLPYTRVYQSGILFLGYSFGLPILAADVGSLKDEILEGKTGFVFRPEDSVDLATTIERYFASDLFADLENRRPQIRAYAMERHSWDVVGQITMGRYAELLRGDARRGPAQRDASDVSLRTDPAPGDTTCLPKDNCRNARH